MALLREDHGVNRKGSTDNMNKSLKNVERALIATGVALVFSGGIASAAILWTSATAAAAQTDSGTQLAAQIGTNPGALADNGPRGEDLMTAAATYIGISAADLKTQLAAGKSLADIAVANGKTRDALITALVNDAKTKIEAAKTAGTITADQATKLEANLTDMITRLVDSTGQGPRR